MATTLVNNEINMISEKLLIYNREFFSKISSAGGQNGLLSETTALKDVVKLNIPAATTEAKYSTDQFGKFIKKIINFNIKNVSNLAETESELCFVNKTAEGTLGYQTNIKDTLINTLKVVNVFVDILEAYKYCIDNEDKVTFDTGYAADTEIKRIELVSDKSRFWHSSAFVPGSDNRNVGFIRPVTLSGAGQTSKNVLFLSIQSFNTEMGDDDYNYKDFFTKGGSAEVNAATKFLKIEARSTPATDTTDIGDYKHQRYSGEEVPKITELSLIDRDKTLIVLLLKTLFELDTTFRKQSVYALYYYYKFVQLYFTLIIHVSNVMFHDVKLNGTSAFRIATFNTTTNKKTHGVSAIEFYNTGSATAVKTASGVTAAGDFVKVPGSQIPSTDANLSSNGSVIIRGKGYLQSPTLNLTPSSKTLKATIVPMVYAETALTNDENIWRLDTVIKEINETITVLLDDLSSTYSLLDNRLVITTNSGVTESEQTIVYPSSTNKVTIRVLKPSIISALNSLKDKYNIENDCIIYDRLYKYSYDIKSIEYNTTNIEITINAVFVDTDIPLNDRSVRVYRSDDGNVLQTKPALETPKQYATTKDFLEIKMKDTSSYKTNYISIRNEIYDLEEKIAFKTSKVERQNTIYETQNSKKIFLERQILAYNIILAIILLILVAINVVKVDKEIVKTVSLSCLGVIILLFVIYFISNMTYVETFAVTSGNAVTIANPLYALGNAGFISSTSNDYGSGSVSATYTAKKIKILNGEINKLNMRFISYFEKLIITLPASENFDFYKEIKEVVENDKENKNFTNNTLDYSKNQNENNINSVKYELENNKLYLNTILISAIIFVGLYNMYINYLTDDKYLSLMIFIFMIIFIIILSYYYITANRRVKTVFKNIYWGPEFSKSF
jgi:hypothetical protein